MSASTIMDDNGDRRKLDDNGDHRMGSVPWARLVATLARHPALWTTALGQVFALAPRGWWRRRPFLPRPDAAYVAFRIRTQYGAAGGAQLDPGDVIAYLWWCRELR